MIMTEAVPHLKKIALYFGQFLRLEGLASFHFPEVFRTVDEWHGKG